MNKIFFEKKRLFILEDILYKCNLPVSEIIINGIIVKKEEFDKKHLNKIVEDLATLEEANVADVSYFHNIDYQKHLENTKAGFIFIKKNYVNFLPKQAIGIIVDDPYYHYALFSEKIYQQKKPSLLISHIHPSAIIHESAIYEKGVVIEEGVTICAGAVIKAGAFIGKNSTIKENSIIGDNVIIGEKCCIDFGAVIKYTVLGKNSYIGPNAVIGKPGFGYAISNSDGTIISIPHWGGVLIGDNFSLGANSCIDRGSLRDTKLGNNVKIDNMVHVAHNVEIGSNCLFAAMVGIAGSAKIGNNVMMGGQVGILSHKKVGNNVMILTQCVISSDVPDNSEMAGFPSIIAKKWRKMVAWHNIMFEKYLTKKSN